MKPPRHTVTTKLEAHGHAGRRFQPWLYGVTSWVVYNNGKIVGRFPWAKLAHKFARWYISRMG